MCEFLPAVSGIDAAERDFRRGYLRAGAILALVLLLELVVLTLL